LKAERKKSGTVIAALAVVIVLVVGAAYFAFTLPPAVTRTGTTTSQQSSLSTIEASSTTSASSHTYSASSSLTTSSSTTSSSATSAATTSASLTSGSGEVIETLSPPVPTFASDLLLNYTLNLSTIGVTPNQVSLNVTGPSGFPLSLAPTQVSLAAPVPVTLSGRPSPGLAPGIYPITVTATGSGKVYSEQLTLHVVKYLVVIGIFFFAPQNYTVPVGSTVYWLRLNGVVGCGCNDGSMNVVFQDPTLPTSATLQQFDTFTYTFTKPGTFPYTCTLQQDMSATLTVTP
jgi:plastocyanin